MNQEKSILRALKKNRTLYRFNLVGDILMVIVGIIVMILSFIVIHDIKWYIPLILSLVYVISALLMYMSQKKYSSAAYEIAKAIKEKVEDMQETYSPKTRLLREQVQHNMLRSVFYCIITGIQLVATWLFAGYYLFHVLKLDGNTKTVSLVCGILLFAFTIPLLTLFFHFLNEKKNREAAALNAALKQSEVPAAADTSVSGNPDELAEESIAADAASVTADTITVDTAAEESMESETPIYAEGMVVSEDAVTSFEDMTSDEVPASETKTPEK